MSRQQVAQVVEVTETQQQVELVISIDDEAMSPAAASGRSLRSERELQDSDELCVYPVGRNPNVIVTFQDFKTLEHEIFLNNIIIDFYLTYLHDNKLKKEDAPNMYIFSKMFYKCMLNQPSSKSLELEGFEKNPHISEAEKAHAGEELHKKTWRFSPKI